MKGREVAAENGLRSNHFRRGVQASYTALDLGAARQNDSVESEHRL